MKNELTELVFILDRSGSMAGMESDTVGGFNAMLEQQRAQPGEAYVSTILFDHEQLVLHDRVPLKYVAPMTQNDYQVRGSTALVDAIGSAIHHIGNIHKYARREDVPRRTLFVITTDGMENASRRYRADEVRAMIEREKTLYGWEFLFLGANIDAVGTAATFGIGADRAANFHNDALGTSANYAAVSRAVSALRCDQPLADDWKDEIDADFRSR